MRSTRIYVDQPLAVGQRLSLSEQASNHLLRVLRLREGDSLTLFNGQDGYNYGAQLLQPSKKEAVVFVSEQSTLTQRSNLSIHLAIGISKGERMDYALQKSVELGVSSIQPLITQRCVVRIDEGRMDNKWRHWQGVIIAACEQSGRCWLPELKPVARLATWLPNQPNPALLLDHRTSQRLVDIQAPVHEIGILVGPEGGLDEQEKAIAIQHGCTPIKLGPRVMRTETAPVAAIAAIQALWGDF